MLGTGAARANDLLAQCLARTKHAHAGVGKASVHPGLSYTRGLGASERGPMMITNRTNAVAFDLPVLF